MKQFGGGKPPRKDGKPGGGQRRSDGNYGYGKSGGGDGQRSGNSYGYGKPSGGGQQRSNGNYGYGKPGGGDGQRSGNGYGYGKPSGGGQQRSGNSDGYGKPSGGGQQRSGGNNGYGKLSGGGQQRSDGNYGYGKSGGGQRQPGSSYGYGKPSGGKQPYQRNTDRPFVRREDERRSDERPRTDRQFAPPGKPDDAAGERTFTPPVAVAQENLLVGRNPIREALKAGRHFEALYVAKGDINGSAKEIVRKAKEQRVIIKEIDRRALDAMSPGHQGLVAIVSAHQYATVADMLALAKERGEEPLLIVLDGITDPHNFGAVARTAECCGAHGVIVCERRAVGMTPGAAKAAAGAFEHIPVARVANIARIIDELKKEGLWIYAADQDGDAAYYKTDLKGAVALVIGDEGEGVSRLALEKCDAKISIPIRGEIESLNASVAAGILLYEVVRQRDAM